MKIQELQQQLKIEQDRRAILERALFNVCANLYLPEYIAKELKKAESQLQKEW